MLIKQTHWLISPHQWTLKIKTDEHENLKALEPPRALEALGHLQNINIPTYTQTPLEGPSAENNPLNCSVQDVEAICSATNPCLFCFVTDCLSHCSNSDDVLVYNMCTKSNPSCLSLDY